MKVAETWSSVFSQLIKLLKFLHLATKPLQSTFVLVALPHTRFFVERIFTDILRNPSLDALFLEASESNLDIFRVMKLYYHQIEHILYVIFAIAITEITHTR